MLFEGHDRKGSVEESLVVSLKGLASKMNLLEVTANRKVTMTKSEGVKSGDLGGQK
jgi:hypothetical protein